MGKFPETKLLSKVTAVVAFVAFVLYMVGFLCHKWLSKHYLFPANITGWPFDMKMSTDLGLIKYCYNMKFPDGHMDGHCGTHGAEDWMYIGFAFALLGLLCGFSGVLLAILSVTVQRTADDIKLKIIEGVCYHVNVISAGVTLLLYYLNKDIILLGNIPITVHFDLAWAYYVFSISNMLYTVTCVTNIIEIVRLRRDSKSKPLADAEHRDFKHHSLGNGSEMNH